ncbi:MAG: FGGY-family carbohydrate kinase [Thermodesulfobacteriota bacterium]|nr:FGGY-family carbohydrate kinase [Thermodesulfobacteriota bacterium]
MKKYIISIDSGTQSIRAVIFDLEGNMIAIKQQEFDPYFSLRPGWAEQHTEDYWDKLCKVTRGVLEEKPLKKDQIIGVGLTSQRDTVIAMDKDGNALRPGIIWLDQRSIENPIPPSAKIKAVFSAVGQKEGLKYIQKYSKFMWIKHNEPEIYNNTAKFVQVTGFFTKKLTGQFRDSYGMISGLWPFDTKKLQWHTVGAVYEAMGLHKGHCADLYRPDSIIGHITSEACKATGIPEGLPLVVGAGDKQCELLGAGAIDPEIAVISFGTATAMEVITDRYIADKKMRFFTWPSAVPDKWDIEMFIFRGFWMVSWFKQEFGTREALEAQKRGIAPETIFDEVVKDIPPGSMGLMLQPYWAPMVYNKNAKGSIIGFGDIHTRAHIYRAILEGIAYELRRLYELVEKKTRVDLREIRVGGGGSKSNVAVQIAADMFNLPVSRMETPELSALGAAMDVTVATGVYPSFEKAVATMVRKGQTFNPDPDTRKIYDKLYRHVYKKLYKAMDPFNKEIARITGYPPKD